jgi:hypothetical protein
VSALVSAKKRLSEPLSKPVQPPSACAPGLRPRLAPPACAPGLRPRLAPPACAFLNTMLVCRPKRVKSGGLGGWLLEERRGTFGEVELLSRKWKEEGLSLDEISRNLANDTVSRRKALALVGAGAVAALLPFAQSAKATGSTVKKCRKTHCNPKAQGNNCGQKFCRCKQVTTTGPPGFQGRCVTKKHGHHGHHGHHDDHDD